MILLLNTKEFLVSINQDPDVSEYTASYMIWYFPGLIIYGISDLYRKYLNSFRMSVIPFLSFTISVSLHPVWTYLFIVHYDFGILGIAIAGFITNFITFSIITIFINIEPTLKKTIVPFFDKSTFERKSLWEYTALALPLISTCFLEVWIWE